MSNLIDHQHALLAKSDETKSLTIVSPRFSVIVFHEILHTHLPPLYAGKSKLLANYRDETPVPGIIFTSSPS